MSYILPNISDSITIKAILTKKGRENMSQGKGLNITKFALSDDEVDYSLWNPNDSRGSNYYGAKIENLPLLEPNPDETKNMKHFLVSLSKDTVVVPKIIDTPTEYSFKSNGEQQIQPQLSVGDTGLGFTLQIPNGSSLFTITEIGDIGSRSASTINITGKPTTLVAVGKSFLIKAKPQIEDQTTTGIIIDNSTGASLDITLSINKLTVGPKGNLF